MHVAMAILRDMFSAAAAAAAAGGGSGGGQTAGSAAQYVSAAVAAAAKAGGGGSSNSLLMGMSGSPGPSSSSPHSRISVSESVGAGGGGGGGARGGRLSQVPVPEGAADLLASASAASAPPPFGSSGPDGQPRPLVSDEGARAVELHRWKSSASVGGGVGARLYGEYTQCRATLKEKKAAYAALTTAVNDCKRDIDALLRHLTAAAAERSAAAAAAAGGAAAGSGDSSGGGGVSEAEEAAAAREATLVGRLRTAKAEHKRRMDAWTDAKAEIEFLQVRGRTSPPSPLAAASWQR